MERRPGTHGACWGGQRRGRCAVALTSSQALGATFVVCVYACGISNGVDCRKVGTFSSQQAYSVFPRLFKLIFVAGLEPVGPQAGFLWPGPIWTFGNCGDWVCAIRVCCGGAWLNGV